MYSSLLETCRTATERHLPYGSHDVTSHPTQVNAPCLNPARQASTQFTPPPGGMEGWVDMRGWLHTKMVYLSAESHPSN